MIQRILGTSIFFFISCAFSFLAAGAAPTAPFVPVAVGGAAFGKAKARLLIAGGNAITDSLFGPNLNQFFALDLAVPWSVDSPAWMALSSKGAPTQSLFTGTVSPDGSLFVTFRSGSTFSYRYRVDKDEWSPSSTVVWDPVRMGVFAATDLSTGSTGGNVYLAGGYQWDDTLMYVYSIATDSMEPNFTIPATSLLDRNSYSAVYVKSRQSIFYFGGISRNGVTSPGDMTEFVPSTRSWSIVNIQGVAGTSKPPHRVNLCMAVNDNGTKLVVFGGMLDSNNPATDIWVLDVPTLIWTMGPMNQQPRWNPVCAIAGNTFVAWGGFNYTSSIESTVLYDIGLNQMIPTYTPPVSYLNEEANSKGSRKIIIISVCSVLAVVIISGLVYWNFHRRKGILGPYFAIRSGNRKKKSDSSSSVTLRDSISSSVSESEIPMKTADYLEYSGQQENPLRPNSNGSTHNQGSRPQPLSATRHQLIQFTQQKQEPQHPQQPYQQQLPQQNRASRYEFDPYPVRDIQDPHAYRSHDHSASIAMQEKRVLQREIEKNKLELELQRQQMQLEQQRHEILQRDQNRIRFGGGSGGGGART